MVIRNEFGQPLSASEFASLARKAEAAARPLPDSFPPGSSFWVVQGIPVVRDAFGFCRAIDGSFVSSEMLRRGGKPLSEHEFRRRAFAFRTRS